MPSVSPVPIAPLVNNPASNELERKTVLEKDLQKKNEPVIARKANPEETLTLEKKMHPVSSPSTENPQLESNIRTVDTKVELMPKTNQENKVMASYPILTSPQSIACTWCPQPWALSSPQHGWMPGRPVSYFTNPTVSNQNQWVINDPWRNYQPITTRVVTNQSVPWESSTLPLNVTESPISQKYPVRAIEQPKTISQYYATNSYSPTKSYSSSYTPPSYATKVTKNEIIDYPLHGSQYNPLAHQFMTQEQEYDLKRRGGLAKQVASLSIPSTTSTSSSPKRK